MSKNLREIYIYRCDPIDFWDGWQPIPDDEQGINLFLAKAKELANKKSNWRNGFGWEGDIREGPYCAPLPCGDPSCKYMVAWKQDNNGDTFIASPFHLPWLEEKSHDILVY